jgi:REP element-mobilizing transposase RayT
MSHHSLRRLASYDYARGGSMFITATLEPRRPLFGRVDHEKVVRSPAGEAAVGAIEEAQAHFGGFIKARSFEVMPDHLHMRISWPTGRGDALAQIGRFVGRIKQRTHWLVAGHAPSIWHERYHDIVCPSERANRTVDAYIRNNALKWWLMHADRSLMHVIEPFLLPEAGGDDFWRAVGNTALLDSPRLVSLRISQKIQAADLPKIVDVCVRGAVEKGYVYVSTFFSPGERAVMKALAAVDDVPFIRLVSTFMELAYRPRGDEPVLFAKRRLLVLSRMPDPAAKPSRRELVDLNFIAAALARASAGGKAVYIQPVKGWMSGWEATPHPFSPSP